MTDLFPEGSNTQQNGAVVPQNDALNAARYYTGIDWTSLIFRLLENIHWILLAAIAAAVATGLYVKTTVKPIYQATSKLYIAGSESTISLADLQLGSSLATDYQEAFKIWHVHEMVDERLGLDYSYSKLAGMVSVSAPSGSHILYITTKSTDPVEAKLLADTYAEVVQDFIAEKMELRRPQLLEIALLPTRPISPDIKSAMIKAFLFGAFAVAAVVVLLYLLDDKIRTADDVENASGLATLGVIAKQTKANGRSAARKESSAAAPSDHAVQIHASLALDYTGEESINTICSAITFAGKSMKRIAVTSHAPNNGKTFVAVQIARIMAERGKKVLLIDGDLRRTVMASQYKMTRVHAGLAHYLSGQCALEDAIYSTNIPNYFILPAGQVVQTPLPLLTSPDFGELMKRVDRLFDTVIVDTPPVGIVIDAAEIAKHCDGSLIVIEYNKQTKGALRYVQKMMEQTETPVIGCVINNYAAKGLYQKKYYYNYGAYRYYNQETDDARARARKKARSGRRKK